MEGLTERDRDLLQAYRKALQNVSYPFSLTEVLELTIKSPAKRYYTSSRGVCTHINKIRSGEEVSLSYERERLINDILPKVEAEEARHPDKILRHIVEDILDSPAPEFYIKVSSAKIILHHIRHHVKMVQEQQNIARNERIEKRKNQRFTQKNRR